jgi:hypothetical protein
MTTGLATRNQRPDVARGIDAASPARPRRCAGGRGAGSMAGKARPNHLGGLARIRAARTITGRFSAEGRAMAAGRRRYFRNGYRSLTAVGAGTICGMNGQTYLRARLAREEAEGIAPTVAEEARQAVRAAIAQRDVDRLRAKGVRPRGEPA